MKCYSEVYLSDHSDAAFSAGSQEYIRTCFNLLLTGFPKKLIHNYKKSVKRVNGSHIRYQRDLQSLNSSGDLHIERNKTL